MDSVVMNLDQNQFLTYNLLSQQLFILMLKEVSTLTVTERRLGEVFRAKTSPGFPLMGENEKFIRALALVSLFAGTEKPILILGETGTGKEAVARTIHNNSARANNIFFPLNCAGIPEGTFESALFGHKKGAFTDAVANKMGCFAVANEGTLFLDEIEDIPLSCQPKLLRAVEFGEVLTVGAEEIQIFRPRIVCSAGNLQEKIQEGKFREDLFYRLSVCVVELPPLRERKDDIPILADYFLKMGNPALSFSPEAMEMLLSHSWTGNIRELKNAVERAEVLSQFEDEIMPKHLNLRSPITSPKTRIEDKIRFLVEEMSKRDDLSARDIYDQLIIDAVKFCGGNKRAAMRLLKIRHPRTIMDRVGPLQKK